MEVLFTQQERHFEKLMINEDGVNIFSYRHILQMGASLKEDLKLTKYLHTLSSIIIFLE